MAKLNGKKVETPKRRGQINLNLSSDEQLLKQKKRMYDAERYQRKRLERQDRARLDTCLDTRTQENSSASHAMDIDIAQPDPPVVTFNAEASIPSTFPPATLPAPSLQTVTLRSGPSCVCGAPRCLDCVKTERDNLYNILVGIGSELILYEVPPKERRKVQNTAHILKGSLAEAHIYDMFEERARRASQLFWGILDLPPSSPPQETDSDDF